MKLNDIIFISLIDKFVATGSMYDRRMENPGRPFTVTTPETLAAIEKLFDENPTDSIRRAAQVLSMNRESCRLILKRFSNFHPGKISIHQKLTDVHDKRRVEFAKKFMKT